MGGCCGKNISDEDILNFIKTVDGTTFELARTFDAQKGSIDSLVDLLGNLDHRELVRVNRISADLQQRQEAVTGQMLTTMECICELLGMLQKKLKKRHTTKLKTYGYLEEEKLLTNANLGSLRRDNIEQNKKKSNPADKIQEESSILKESSPLLPKNDIQNDEREIDDTIVVAEQKENDVLESNCKTTVQVLLSEKTDKFNSRYQFLTETNENQSHCLPELNIVNDENINSECTKRKCQEKLADMRVQLQEELESNKQLETLVEKLKSSLENKEKQLQETTSSLNRMENEKADDNEHLKEIQLVQLQEELKNNEQLKISVETLKRSLGNKEKQLEEVANSLDRLEKEKVEDNERAKKNHLTLVQLQEELKKNEISVETLEHSLENNEKQLVEVTLSLDRMEKEKADANNHAKEVELSLVKIKEDLKETEGKLDHEKLKRVQTEVEVKEMNISLKQKEQHIQEASELVESLKQDKKRYEATLFELRQIIVSLEQRNQSLIETNELLAKRITEQNILRVQVYCPSQSGMMMEVEKEMMSIIQTKLDNRANEFKFVKCVHIADVNQSLPTLLLCINTSRLGTDVSTILQKFQANSKMAVVVFHHKDAHALPNESSSRVLVGQEFKQLGGIFDMAFLSGKGIYSCKMNDDNISKLIHFIVNFL